MCLDWCDEQLVLSSSNGTDAKTKLLRSMCAAFTLVSGHQYGQCGGTSMSLGRIDLGACRKQESPQCLQKAEATPSLFVAVGDLGDFCPQFFVFFTRQLGHFHLPFKFDPHIMILFMMYHDACIKKKQSGSYQCPGAFPQLLIDELSHFAVYRSSWFALDCRPK